MTSELPRSTVAGTGVATAEPPARARRGLLACVRYRASIAAASAKSRAVMPDAA
jgi:hypothetical protein